MWELVTDLATELESVSLLIIRSVILNLATSQAQRSSWDGIFKYQGIMGTPCLNAWIYHLLFSNPLHILPMRRPLSLKKNASFFYLSNLFLFFLKSLLFLVYDDLLLHNDGAISYVTITMQIWKKNRLSHQDMMF